MIWPMWRNGTLILVIGVGVIAILMIRGPFSGVRDVAHEFAQFHLRLTASSIYEYHARTGQWPRQIADLEKTSLPLKSPHWREMLDGGAIVVVWHKALKPNPPDNADEILAYYNKGLISEGGRSWVCWGDLRTEYVETEALHAYLAKLKR
jgi:hypothetical protein